MPERLPTWSIRRPPHQDPSSIPRLRPYAVSFKDKDAAKALGDRWDGDQRQWYVPDGRELPPFARWLPAGAPFVSESDPAALYPARSPVPSNFSNSLATRGSELALGGKKGMSLSSLLAGVSHSLAQAYKAGVWTLVEVVELRTNGGHVFMGVSERDAFGAVLAKSSAVIWQSTACSVGVHRAT